METGQAPPTCTNGAQSLHALVNELKSVQSPSVLDNGAVLLLPKHRCCCAGSCHGVEPRDNKEIREVIEIRESKEIQETQGDTGHSLEGIWASVHTSTTPYFVIYTVQAKPGYILGGELTGIRPGRILFWFRSGDGEFKDVLEGKWAGRASSWEEVKLYWDSDNNSFKTLWGPGTSNSRSTYTYVRFKLGEGVALTELD